MKQLYIVTTLALLLVAALISQAGCEKETEVPTSESNRWLELLNVLPENAVTLKAAFLQDNAYLEEKKQQYPQITAEYTIIRNHPLLSGTGPGAYSDDEWKETLGFIQADVDQRIYAGRLPMDYYEAVRGRFSRDDIDNAVRTGPMNEMLEVVSYKGQEYYSWGEDNEINIQYRSNVRPLGRGYRLALIDDFIFWVRWTDGMKKMIDSYEDNIKSLVDNEDYKLLAGALEDLDTVTAFFSTESQSLSYISKIYRQIIQDPGDNERRQLFVEEINREVRLKPYQAFATGTGLDEKGYYLAIVLSNPSEEVARENATLLEQRINESKIVWAWHSQNSDTWSDPVESMEIESKGRLTIAKLYGVAAQCWANFNVMQMLGPYEPLLITSSPDEETNGEETPFADSNLEEAVREAISKPEGPILPPDLEQLTFLLASGQYIRDITGLELCTNLRDLELANNYISDISPLAPLTRLTHLNLQENQIIDVSPPANLTSLESLDLGSNPLDDITPLTSLSNLTRLSIFDSPIADISPLSSLTNLIELILTGNQISDVSPLASLTNLITLSLTTNQISDISPLASLPNLWSLSLSGNQISDIEPLVLNNGLSEGDWVNLMDNSLSDTSVDVYIPQLEERGVDVEY